ncbi:hypothetical protein [Methanococcus maripaludis]|uniref:protein adenylyltransferase n=1 Tax=Methanococcus maripaludis TaxID=39152 RepID=A0A8T4H419_METMI|nr:hypothetical protein [Methanococcus maripaludis]MBM7408371.1 hypothetical protein [Methanococcus maripaludis]MBP2220041.1 hypothetical protein [Methanococcus maripaludis]
MNTEEKKCSEKPQSIEEYKLWLKDYQNIENIDKYSRFYESVTLKIKRDIEKSNFWINLNEQLKEYNGKYRLETNYNLFTEIPQLHLDVKSWDSFLLKTFRFNVLENKKWPNQPQEGWLLPENWFGRINDIVRTLIVVKYMDGVKFLADGIEEECNNCNLKAYTSYQAKDEGYYAVHLYSKIKCEIPKDNFSFEEIPIKFEIQITTQLQEVIRGLLHKHYEEKRKNEPVKENWKWDYKHDEFSTNYLGHILHYIEGMIVEIREKQNGE